MNNDQERTTGDRTAREVKDVAKTFPPEQLKRANG